MRNRWNNIHVAAPIIWIIDSQQWPRALLRAELIERGFEAIGYTKLHTGLTVLRRPGTLRPRVIVLELSDQAVSTRLLDRLMSTRIPVVLLVSATDANEPVLKKYNWAAMMRRPFTIGAVAEKVQEIVREER